MRPVLGILFLKALFVKLIIDLPPLITPPIPETTLDTMKSVLGEMVTWQR
jgi:hypothetical protein